MQFPRVIPTLLIEDGYVVKGSKFCNHRYIGDPVNALRIFNEKQVDEICILNIDKDRHEPDYQMIAECASEAFIPLSYGGQIYALDHVKAIFDLGVEKVIFNSALHLNPELITETASLFGAQSVVVKIDYQTSLFGKKKLAYHSGATAAKLDMVAACQRAQELGAGELILADIERDGAGKGFDNSSLAEMVKQIDIPILGCCGAGSIADIKQAIKTSHCSGVVGGDMFVFYGAHKAVLLTYPDYHELIEIWG